MMSVEVDDNFSAVLHYDKKKMLVLNKKTGQIDFVEVGEAKKV